MHETQPTIVPGGRLVRLDVASLTDAELDRLVGFSNALAGALTPAPPPMSDLAKLGTYRSGWDGVPPEAYVVSAQSSGELDPIATLDVWAPTYDNRTIAYLDVRVGVEQRRRGVGSALLAFGEARARALGRTVVGADYRADDHAAAGFAHRHGYTDALLNVWRRLELAGLDRDQLASFIRPVHGRADGYELVRVAGPLPADLLDGSARLEMALNDAPRDDSAHEDEVFTPARLRALELAEAQRGGRLYRVIARRRSDGELAGHTVISTQPELPDYAEQYSTGVARAHRGRGLGLALKAEMLAWLTGPAGPERQLRAIDTYNAASNAHMITVNERLGFTVMAQSWECEKHV